MSKDFNTNTGNKMEWFTPPEIVRALGLFDVDVCTSIIRPFEFAPVNYTIEDDGLIQEWKGRVWCNPPYGNKTFDWMDKLAKHGNGIALIFARTETKGFHKSIWQKADAVFFFKGRLRFYKQSGVKADSANAASCLIAYGKSNVEAIKKSGLRGQLVVTVL